MNKERLLNVAKALRESKNPDKFDMNLQVHLCGTPGCAFGHYAARDDLQNEFSIGPTWTDRQNVVWRGSRNAVWYDEVGDHFDLNSKKLYKLFSIEGCGGAKTAIEAAEYIEKFVAQQPE